MLSTPCSATRPQSLPPDILAAVAVLRDVYPAEDASASRVLPHRQKGPQLDLANTDLSRADLRGVDLRGADLRNARLFEAQVSDADLSDARLAGIDARAACFANTYFSDASFTEGGTDALRRARAANLRRADLTSVFAIEGDVRHVDFRHAVLKNSVFYGTKADGARVNGTGWVVTDGGELYEKAIAAP